MSPTAIFDNAPDAADPANLKAKLVAGQAEVETASPPVADNFMYDFKYNHALPTIDVLGQDIAADVNAQEVAEELLAKLEQIIAEKDEAGQWTVQIAKAGETRTLHPKHVVSSSF